ncbi:MAG: ABC transporter permease [Clostridium sp.]
MKESYLDYKIKEDIDINGGNFDVRIQAKGYKNLDNLCKESIIDKLSLVTPLGISRIESSKYSIDIKGYEENITGFINMKIVEGSSPSSDNEIALEKWILDYLPKKYEIGDKIKLDYNLKYEGTNEFEALKDSNEFTLVGIFEYTSALSSEVGKAWVTRDFAEKKLVENSLKDKSILYEGYIYLNPKYNIADGKLLLDSSNEYNNVSFIDNFSKEFFLQTIKIMNLICNALFIIVGVVSSINIYNTFMVSISERKKEFGMIRAIGASTGRIKAMVLSEGLILGAIFIPIGLIIGNIITKSVMIILGYDQISSLFSIPIGGVIVSVIIGLSSIILGSYFPARNASKVSPMEVMQGNEDINISKKNFDFQTMGFLKREMKFYNKIGIINIKRSKKKFLTTIISLSITIIMLISVFYLINQSDTITKLKNSYGDAEFKISSYSNKGIVDKELDEISDIEGIKILSKVKESTVDMNVSKKMLTEKGYSYFEAESKRDKFKSKLLEEGIYRFNPRVYGYSNAQLESLKRWVIYGSIDIEEMNKRSTAIFILYSFVFIVGIVSIINLINIMKMNVITRSKEIGMLRAIGLGEDEVRKMIKVEGFIYDVTASILGSTLGCMLTYFIHKKLVPNTT